MVWPIPFLIYSLLFKDLSFILLFFFHCFSHSFNFLLVFDKLYLIMYCHKRACWTCRIKSRVDIMIVLKLKMSRLFAKINNGVYLNNFVKYLGIIKIWHHTSKITKMSWFIRKPIYCICKNKGTDQLRSNCEADQCLCFRYSDSTIPLLAKSKISSL